jgi:hypothetical protein
VLDGVVLTDALRAVDVERLYPCKRWKPMHKEVQLSVEVEHMHYQRGTAVSGMRMPPIM